MPTLILSPRHTEDSQQLWRAAGQRGWRTERLTGWQLTDGLRHVDEPVLYVEVLMAPMLAEQFGIAIIEPPVDWLPRLPEDYRRRDIKLITLGEARCNFNPRFVKPPNDKSFTASICRGEDLTCNFPDETPVLSAEVVSWNLEYRCFLLNRELQTYSLYLRDGELQKERGFESTDEEDAEMEAFVKSICEDPNVELPTAIVMDVGIIDGRGWAVVELNSAWGSGLYGCDPMKALNVIREAMIRKS